MKHFLVTGGAGFIGSNFVHYILDKYPEVDVKVVDLLTYAGDKGRLADVMDKIEFIQADICDYQAMREHIKGIDTLVHFAAESHVDRSIADPSPFLRTNVLGTDIVARLALEQGVEHFHHVSTDEVFGTLELDSKDAFSEATPYNPRSPYSASKAASDHVVRAYGETYGLPYTITNCSNNYGPADSPARIIPLFITNALQDKPLPIYGSGKNVRDYLAVEDHCSAIDAVMNSGKTEVTYCVGGADGQRNGIEVAETILEILGKPKSLMEFVKDRPGHDPRYAIDAAKIRKDLGWKPSVDFKTGIARTIDWYRKHEDWWRPYKERISLLREEGLAKAQKVST